MKKIIATTLLLISSTGFARDISLEEAIELSINNSKNIQIASKSMKIGEINLGRAFKLALPTLAYEGSYLRNEHSLKETFNSDGAKEKYEKYGYSSKLIATYPIFQGGAILGGIKGAKAQSNILDYSFLKEKSNVRLNTISLYSNIINYQKNLEALEASKKELDIRYKEQNEKLKMKLIIKADLLKTEYALLNVESEIVRVKNNISIEMKKLKIEIGEQKEEELVLAPLVIPMGLSSNMSLEDDMLVAKNSSLNALIAKNKLEYSEAEKMVAFSDNLPKASAFVSYGGQEKLHSKDVFHDDELRGGVRVTWELFSFGSGIDKYRVARNNYDIEELNNSKVQDEIEINLTTAYSEVIRLEKLRKATLSSMEASKENFSIDKKRYEAGLLSTQDYLNSESQYRDSRVNYNKAEANYLVAFEKYRSLLI